MILHWSLSTLSPFCSKVLLFSFSLTSLKSSPFKGVENVIRRESDVFI